MGRIRLWRWGEHSQPLHGQPSESDVRLLKEEFTSVRFGARPPEYQPLRRIMRLRGRRKRQPAGNRNFWLRSAHASIEPLEFFARKDLGRTVGLRYPPADAEIGTQQIRVFSVALLHYPRQRYDPWSNLNAD